MGVFCSFCEISPRDETGHQVAPTDEEEACFSVILTEGRKENEAVCSLRDLL